MGLIFFLPGQQLGQRKKEPDSGIVPISSNRPSIVIEIGSSESLTQLKIDAQLWLEHMSEVSKLRSLLFKHWNFFIIGPTCDPCFD